MKRTERAKLWFTGTPLATDDNSRCSVSGCRGSAVREFDCGFFCWKHFTMLPECTAKGCDNPVVLDREIDTGGLCRSCFFDYSGHIEIYQESELSRCAVFGLEAGICGQEFREAVDKGAKKVGVKSLKPRESWFRAPVEKGEGQNGS